MVKDEFIVKDCYHSDSPFFDLICRFCSHYINREEDQFCQECRLIIKLIANPTNYNPVSDVERIPDYLKKE